MMKSSEIANQKLAAKIIKQQLKKQEDNFDVKGAWLEFLESLGDLSYREWRHLKERNLMCIWLQKKTSAIKGSVYVHKKKA